MAFSPWAAGERITAARLNEISPVWATWVPEWSTNTGVNTPSFGNATISARYTQTADLVVCRLEITFGSTTSFGGGGASDNWRFTLPVVAASTALIAGYGEAQDASAVDRYPLRPRLTSTEHLELETSGGATNGAGVSTGLIDAVSPFIWANGDAIRALFQYEAG